MKTYQELLAETKARVREIGVKDAMALRHTTGDAVFLDVRDPNEYNLGKIPGAVTISRSHLEKNVEAQVPRDKPVVVYCANGNRSALAAVTLRDMGYEHVSSMSVGFNGWTAIGGDID